jgi:hypothetical protein
LLSFNFAHGNTLTVRRDDEATEYVEEAFYLKIAEIHLHGLPETIPTPSSLQLENGAHHGNFKRKG